MQRIDHVENRLIAATEPAIERVALDAPWTWLAAGWRDLWAAPRVGLFYGGVLAGLAVALTYGLMLAGYESLILALAGGFLLIAPIAAIGLYETSRRLEAGESVDVGVILARSLRSPGQLAFFGGILAFVYVLWLQIAFLLFMLFMGGKALPPADQFIPTLLFTAHGLGLLVTGTLVGAVLAFIIFVVSAIAPPLMMTRRIDAVSAIRASIAAVRLNPKPMLLWAALIAGFMALGIATLYVGLVVAFPLIGHATWHAFRDLIREPLHHYL
jgi:uncharacterized membrane protein